MKKSYYLANHAEILAKQKAYRDLNKEKIKESRSLYYQKRKLKPISEEKKQKKRLANLKWELNNRDTLNAKRRLKSKLETAKQKRRSWYKAYRDSRTQEWKEAQKAAQKAYSKAWREANKEPILARRKANKQRLSIQRKENYPKRKSYFKSYVQRNKDKRRKYAKKEYEKRNQFRSLATLVQITEVAKGLKKILSRHV